ncbi:MAG: hypothetical protein OH316_01340 [Candidatus Parvarchaeota archaeon]|nr:hypothetical protein [Candidatus Parvarchaeota archaeon]
MLISSKRGIADYILMIIIIVIIMIVVLIFYLIIFAPNLWTSLLPGVPKVSYF